MMLLALRPEFPNERCPVVTMRRFARWWRERIRQRVRENEIAADITMDDVLYRQQMAAKILGVEADLGHAKEELEDIRHDMENRNG